MNLRLIAVCFIFTRLLPLSAQDKYITIEGLVKPDDAAPATATIVVSKGGKNKKTYTTKPDGRYKLELDFQSVFDIEFVLSGYVTRKFVIDTKVPKEIYEEGIMPFFLDVLMFKPMDNLSEETGRIKFDEREYSLVLEQEHLRTLKAQEKKVEAIKSGNEQYLAKLEEERKRKEAEEARLKREAEEKRLKEEEEARLKREAEEKRLKEEEEARLKREAEEKRLKEEEEARLKREAEEKRLKEEEEARLKREAEEKRLKEEEEARLKREKEEAERRLKEELARLRKLNNIQEFPTEQDRLNALSTQEKAALRNSGYVVLKPYDTIEQLGSQYYGYVNFGIGGGNIEITREEFERLKALFK
jgi:chemotaxis protein histidine kinase CheA